MYIFIERLNWFVANQNIIKDKETWGKRFPFLSCDFPRKRKQRIAFPFFGVLNLTLVFFFLKFLIKRQVGQSYKFFGDI